MKDRDFSPSKKAAIVLLSLGEEIASQILAHLEEREVRQITAHMATTSDLPISVVNEVLNEFEKDMSSPNNISLGGKEMTHKLLSKAIGVEKADSLIREMAPPVADSPPFESLREVDPKVMANFLQGEHPQTMAIVLAYLEPEQSANVLRELPEESQIDCLVRMASLERISPDVVHEIDEVLRKEIRMGSAAGKAPRKRGVAPVAKMLSYMEKSNVDALMASLNERNPELASKLSDLMFVFNDLILVDNRGIQSILREVSRDDLLLALKGANDEVKEIIYRNMSDRARKMMEDDMEIMGPVRLSDVEKAQKAIVKVASRLESEGKIIVRRGWDEVVV